MAQVGSTNHNAKLTDKQVREIKTLLSLNATLGKLAKVYGVHPKVIWKIKKGQAWKHIQ
jgi:hypothetical protein